MTNFFKHKMRGKSPGEIAGWVILGGLGIAALAILFGFVIMWLWNWLMPEIFGLTTLTYWQAVGLFILSKILIGTGGSGGGKSHKSKHNGKNKCCGKDGKKEFSKWANYDKFWKEEGDQAYQNYIDRLENSSHETSKTEEN
jgi:hypothetical protein